MTWRTHMCGEPRKELVGERMTLAGWAARRRDHGGLVFVDLRDRAGITQLVINPELAAEAAELAHQIRNEFVLRAEGTLVARSPDTVNPNMPTGEVELQVDELQLVSRSTPLPFQLDEENVDETLRLRYRWLDLRRDKLQRNIALRAQMVGIIRREMEAADFLDIQTPILFKPTPEGARDFVVPSRLHPGHFYALPQSPQILKQLTMVAGFDRYYQIAICFRDEDLRADRVQEITQLDVEMSFPDQEFLFALMERMFARIWRECLGIEIPTPFPRMTFEEADRRFGTDKPDTRFGLELEDATEVTRGSQFGVFAGAERVRFLRVPQEFSRGDLARLEEIAKEWGAKGLAYLVYDEEGEVRSPIAKFLSEDELAAFRSDPATTVLFAADTRETTSRVLGALRAHLGRELGLIDEDAFTFLWVYDFPMFEYIEELGRWTAVHHPFTRPTKEWEGRFHEEPGTALAHAYDLIVNGNELGGGSFRIHEPDLQAKVFDLLSLSPEEQRSKFGFLLDALAMGAPPHGGIALGIDRMTMVLAGEPNLRDVIAFPKNQAAVDPMSGAPSEVTREQLDELGIRLVPAKAVRAVPPLAAPPEPRPTEEPQPPDSTPTAEPQTPEPQPVEAEDGR
jgi:aspartyl-tRNA synthetase